jgi:hypothetical protein
VPRERRNTRILSNRNRSHHQHQVLSISSLFYPFLTHACSIGLQRLQRKYETLNGLYQTAKDRILVLQEELRRKNKDWRKWREWWEKVKAKSSQGPMGSARNPQDTRRRSARISSRTKKVPPNRNTKDKELHRR